MESCRHLIENTETNFDLADGILSLKRSLDTRLKLIENIYQLKDIEFTNRPKGYLELLGEYKIVRPYILKRLLDIRNDIEHNDAIPPDKDYCKEIVDAVWYFLRSTDPIVQKAKINVEYTFIVNKNETHYGCIIDIENNKYPNCDIWGWFPLELLSTIEKEDYFKVLFACFEGKREVQKRNKDKSLHNEKLETDRFISGSTSLDGSTYRFLMETILAAY